MWQTIVSSQELPSSDLMFFPLLCNVTVIKIAAFNRNPCKHQVLRNTPDNVVWYLVGLPSLADDSLNHYSYNFRLSLTKEVLEGLRCLFDTIIATNLLYNEELPLHGILMAGQEAKFSPHPMWVDVDKAFGLSTSYFLYVEAIDCRLILGL